MYMMHTNKLIFVFTLQKKIKIWDTEKCLNNTLRPTGAALGAASWRAASLSFRHPRVHLGGGGESSLIYFLIAIELSNINDRKVWDVLNPTISDVTTLGHILIFQVRSIKNIALR